MTGGPKVQYILKDVIITLLSSHKNLSITYYQRGDGTFNYILYSIIYHMLYSIIYHIIFNYILYIILFSNRPDHGLAHLVHGSGHGPTRGRWVAVEDHLGAGVLPHVEVGEDGQLLHCSDSRLAVVLHEGLLGSLEGLLDGSQLALAVGVAWGFGLKWTSFHTFFF